MVFKEQARNCYPFIEREILPFVEKPGRYIGNELNVSTKVFSRSDVSVALIYPDLYDVGMSYYGFQILYHILNRESDIRADRAYAPWPDFEAQLRKQNACLYGLETKAPLNKFDVIGFNLPYEMTFTNVLNILDLAQLPVLSKQRQDGPIVMAGGSNVYNPEPLADFIDLFVIGDSEDLIVSLVRFLANENRKGTPRKKILKSAAEEFEGVYIPVLYEDLHESENGLYITSTDNGKTEQKIKAQRIPILRSDYYPDHPLIPVVEIAQDRFVTEIMRGCTQGCRFCQAGIVYRPVRERPPEEIQRQVTSSLKSSGYNDLSLLSLSSSDYCGLAELIKNIAPIIEKQRVGLSLPSLRLDSFTESIANIACMSRKSGLTFAPEAGSERLRSVINKSITEEDLLESVDIAVKYGWRSVKLYFMLGLPTETEDDVAEIVRLTKAVYYRADKRMSINITLSTFVPKPFTPFQWEAQDSPDEIQKKIDIIKKGLASYKRIRIMARDPFYSQLEGAISRGDRRLGGIIHKAWRNGATFDSWREFFQRDLWDRVLAEQPINIKKLTGERNTAAPLPWDHIDPLVKKEFLLKERDRAYRAEKSADCRTGCIDCGVCAGTLSMQMVEKTESEVTGSSGPSEKEEIHTENKYRLRYQKEGPARFIAHLDTLRLFQQALRRAGLDISFTQGYNRRPKISAGHPLPLGYTSTDEYIDITLLQKDEQPRQHIGLNLPKGLRIISSETVPLKSASLFAATTGFHYEISLFDELGSDIEAGISNVLKQPEIIIERTRKERTKQIDIRPFIGDILIKDKSSLQLLLNVINGQTARPNEVLQQLEISPPYEVCRLKTIF